MQDADACFIDVLLTESDAAGSRSADPAKKIEFRCLQEGVLILQGQWTCMADTT